MTDIVERLRLIDPTLELRYCEDVTKLHEVGQWCHEGADEIERLRGALERLAELDGFVCGRPMLGQEVINYTQFVARAALGEKE